MTVTTEWYRRPQLITHRVGRDRHNGRMKDESGEVIGYQSAMDMPSFVKLKKRAYEFRALGTLLPKKDRDKIRELTGEMEKLAADVDGFYERLGPRHWIFHDRIPTSVVRDEILLAASVDDAEDALCAIYEDTDWMKFMVMSTMRFPEMRAREKLVEHARRDFDEQRYYAVVLLLLTLMDGFVNDVQNMHKGLHARDAEEVQSWDTAVGHHMGLTSTQASFRKSYSKRVDVEVYDLARNGILHGNITNYDNRIVACKAWNRLFAVVDWASSLEKAAVPEDPDPTWAEVLKRVQDLNEQKKAIGAWVASAGTANTPDDYQLHPSMASASEFLTLWTRSNWGHLSRHFMRIGKGEAGKATPKEINSTFAPYKLDAFRILGYETKAPAIAEVQAELQMGGQIFPAVLRMAFTTDNGDVRVEGIQEGKWRVVWRSPDMFNGDLWKAANF